MRTIIVGAGPAGLYTAIAMARRGHAVAVVDRDSGPAVDGTWRRKGVMQFRQPHGFRGQVIEALQAEMPDVWDGLMAAGADTATLPGRPDRPVALLCRRVVFERVLRAAAVSQPGVVLLTGHVDSIAEKRGRAAGVLVDGRAVDADLVIDASGRASRVTRAIRGAGEGGDCGAAYVSRHYQLRPGAEPGPLNWHSGWSGNYHGYTAVVFRHDNRTFSVLVVYHGEDRPLRALRSPAVFEAAMRAIPAFGVWTGPGRSQAITEVLPGGKLYNSYRGQLDHSGRPVLPGMISLGDAVCTTTPLAGRGIALSLMQARELIRLLDEQPRDLDRAAVAFDDWCRENIKPWFEDHSYTDADRVRRWSGQDVDIRRPLPSDLIVAATEADPDLHRVADPYAAMLALPSSLAAIEPRAREIYAGGWRPAVPAGPSRDQLAELCASILATAA